MKHSQIIVAILVMLTLVGMLLWRGRGAKPSGNYFEFVSETLDNSPPDSAKASPDKQPLFLYENIKYGFEINLPEGASATSLEEEAGESILIQNSNLKNPNNKFEMQIFVSDFDEDIVLTAERISQDIPDINMQNVENVKVGEVSAVAFVDAGQNTREIWFVKEGFLYQITSHPDNDVVVGAIMQSWKWGK